MKKKVAVISMGQSPAQPACNDVYRSLSDVFSVEMTGLLDGMDAEAIADLAPDPGESLIVSSLRNGQKICLAEHHAMRLVNEQLLHAQRNGCAAALILCTGHFETPDLEIPVFVPERILFSLFRSLGIKKLGAIVPKAEQIEASLAYYSEFSPIIHAASPYGAASDIEAVSSLFRQSDVDLLLADCMGFTEELGTLISNVSGKKVFVPRTVLPELIKSIIA